MPSGTITQVHSVEFDRARVLVFRMVTVSALVLLMLVPARSATTAAPPAAARLTASTTASSYFTPVAPTRILDTRSGLGAPATPVRAHQSITVHVTGTAGVPTTATAAIVNLTEANPTSTGYVTAYPTGTPITRASSLNFTAKQTVANLSVIPLGSNGEINLYNGTGGTINLIADIQGYYSPTGTSYTPVAPTRILDTRSGLGAPATPVRAHQSITVHVTGTAGVPTTATAAIVNLTEANPTSTGYVTAYPTGTPITRASSLNFTAKQTVANLSVIPLGSNGEINLYNGTGGTINLIADIQGYYSPTGTSYTPVAPTRILDTRSGLGAPATPVRAHQSITVHVTGTAGVPTTATAAIVNLTEANPTSTGYVTAYPTGTPITRASSLNFTAKQTVANLSVIPLGSNGEINLYNGTGGTINLIADIQGYYSSAPSIAVPAQTTPAPISTSHYPRDPNAFTNTAIFHNMGAYDAPFNPSGHAYMVLMDIGGQSTRAGVAGVLLSATNIWVSNASLVAGMQAFIDGYTSTQLANAPVTIAIGTNNDVDVSATSGAVWASQVINPLVSYAARYSPNVTIAGADDIEPGFSATQAQTQTWLAGYLANTGAQFVFNGSADGCSTIAVNKTCNNGWTEATLYGLAGGAAPSRIIGLPQVYNSEMAAQWKYISLTGYLAGQPKVNFGGPLTEYNACAPANQPCSSINGVSAWNLLWTNINSDPRTAQTSLPFATDLEINCYLRMPTCS